MPCLSSSFFCRSNADDHVATLAIPSGFSLPAMPWSDWEISSSEIQICKRRNGALWELGSGSFGKARLCPLLQPRTVSCLERTSFPLVEHTYDLVGGVRKAIFHAESVSNFSLKSNFDFKHEHRAPTRQWTFGLFTKWHRTFVNLPDRWHITYWNDW